MGVNATKKDLNLHVQFGILLLDIILLKGSLLIITQRTRMVAKFRKEEFEFSLRFICII